MYLSAKDKVKAPNLAWEAKSSERLYICYLSSVFNSNKRKRFDFDIFT